MNDMEREVIAVYKSQEPTKKSSRIGVSDEALGSGLWGRGFSLNKL